MNTLSGHACRQETVILVHGLYLRGFCMAPLARRLARAGYRTVLFSYPSRRSTPADLVELGQPVLAAVTTPTVHWVAHSLGGLIVRQIFALASDLPPGRVVTLGAPHQGNQVARRLYDKGCKFMLGRSSELGLLGDAPPWYEQGELGSIAGTLNVGLGRLFGPVSPPADGTVAVAETYLPGMTDHICLPVSHIGLLFSSAAAGQVRTFLATGRFLHEYQDREPIRTTL